MSAKHVNKKINTKTLKTLNMVILVLSCIAIAISLVAIVYLIIAYVTANSTDAVSKIAKDTETGLQTSIKGNNLIVGQSSTNIGLLANMGLGLMLGFSIFSLATSLYSLFICINIIKQFKKKKVNTIILSLNIVNAITSFISFNIVRSIFLIIYDCFLYKFFKQSKAKKQKPNKTLKFEVPDNTHVHTKTHTTKKNSKTKSKKPKNLKNTKA